MGTFEVRADTVKSRLYIQLVGGVFAEDDNVRYATSIGEADNILDHW